LARPPPSASPFPSRRSSDLVEFRNTSDADLAAGPVVVYDGDSYAGDAQVGFTSRGQDRLLTYAVDQDVRALTDHEQTSRTTRVKDRKSTRLNSSHVKISYAV